MLLHLNANHSDSAALYHSYLSNRLPVAPTMMGGTRMRSFSSSIPRSDAQVDARVEVELRSAISILVAATPRRWCDGLCSQQPCQLLPSLLCAARLLDKAPRQIAGPLPQCVRAADGRKLAVTPCPAGEGQRMQGDSDLNSWLTDLSMHIPLRNQTSG